MVDDYDTSVLEKISQVEVEKADENIITLSSGVRLRTKKVPVLRIQALVNKFKYPPVPEIWDESRERTIRNPNHPDYLAARQAVDIERTLAVIDAIAAMGTEIVYRPENIPALEDDAWVDEITVGGLEFDLKSPTARYLAWVKYVAIVDQDDIALIAKKAGLSLGIAEERVAASLQSSFQDN